jgi:hypothetical protein
MSWRRKSLRALTTRFEAIISASSTTAAARNGHDLCWKVLRRTGLGGMIEGPLKLAMVAIRNAYI